MRRLRSPSRLPLVMLRPTLLCAALLAATVPAHAESIAISISGAGSASSASVSESIEASSHGSSKARDVVAGDYRVVEIAEAPGRPGTLRLALEPLDAAAGRAFVLYLPPEAGAAAALAAGDVVRAREHDYGYEFQRADTRQPFFLALHDDWQQQLAPRAVLL